MRFKIFIVCVFLTVNRVTSKKIVETTHGSVSGKVLKTLLNDVKYHGYMGIPYASPPVNRLRFLPPRPAAPWPGVLSATKDKQACIQYNTNVKKGQPLGIYGSEDCLYLDIFTPQPDNNKRPVIVFLHNEHFKLSYNKTKDYMPDFFIEEDVVLATISHRLSVFGFLSLDDATLPGNSGLKDIVAGLQWITNNVERFGGDPNRITLMGSQGGAAAVDLLIHSDARKLFHSAILQGGTAWTSMYLAEDTRKRAVKLGEIFGIASGNSDRLLNELSEVPARDLLEKELVAIPPDYNKDHQRSLLPFGPIVERPGGVVIDYPERAARVDLPVMIGFNSREGLEKSLQYLVEPKYLSFVEKDFVLLMPGRVDFRFDPTADAYENAVKDVKKFYFPKGRVTIRNAPEFITYIGDVFTAPINDMVEHYSNISTENVYYYNFDYFSDLSENKNDLLRLSVVEDGTWGAASGDELCYLFKCPSLKSKYLSHNTAKSEEIFLVRKLVRMWTNFAKYRNPTPQGDDVLKDLKWPPYSNSKEYLHIDRLITVKRDICRDRFQFWRDFVGKWRRRAVDGIVSWNNKKDEL